MDSHEFYRNLYSSLAGQFQNLSDDLYRHYQFPDAYIEFLVNI